MIIDLTPGMLLLPIKKYRQDYGWCLTNDNIMACYTYYNNTAKEKIKQIMFVKSEHWMADFDGTSEMTILTFLHKTKTVSHIANSFKEFSKHWVNV